MRLAIHTLGAAVALGACGTRLPPAPTDAGARDAYRPVCLDVPGDRSPPSNLEECGACIASHERLAGPFSEGTREVYAVSLPQGLLVLQASVNAFLTLIRRDGSVEHVADLPWVEGDLPPFHYFGMVYLPSRSEVWVFGHRRQQVPASAERRDWGEIVVYGVSDGGVTRLAEAVTSAIGPLTSSQGLRASAEDWILGSSYDGLTADSMVVNEAFVTLRREGSEIVIERAADVAGFLPSSNEPIVAWANPSGGVVLLATRRWLETVGPEIYDVWESSLVEIDRTLAVTRGPEVALSFRADGTGAMLIRGSVVLANDGRAMMGSVGRLEPPPEPTTPVAIAFVQWVGPGSDPAFPVPGVPVNADQPLPLRPSFGLVGDDVAVTAIEDVGDGYDTWSQIVHPDGSLEFSSMRRTPAASQRGRELHAVSATDGAGHGYQVDIEGPPPGGDAYTVDRLNERLEWAWPERVAVQGCNAQDSQMLFGYTADVDDGIWLVWQEFYHDPFGNGFSVLKTTWVRSDGTFAW